MAKKDSMTELLSKVSIKDVAEAVMSLKPKGSGFIGLSPFSTEKSPSCVINPETNTFYCFSTGTGGGILDFYSIVNNVSKRDAFLTLAEMYGVEVEEKEEDSSIIKMQKCLKAAHAFYMEYQSEAVKYITSDKVKLDPEVASRYQLGYAPVNGNLLLDSLRYQGFDDDTIISCSLATRFDNNKVSAFFYDRVMFPIKDQHGKLIALSGRRMRDFDANGEPIKSEKYLHSRVTPLFKKENTLWGIEHARKLIKQKEYVILMEGFMDVIPAQEAGEPAVGTLGAVPSKTQLNALAKYATDIYMCSDNDKAGKNALFKTFFMLEEMDLDVLTYSLTLPGSKDPGDFIRDFGVEAFQKAVKMSLPDTAYLVQVTIEKFHGTITRESALIRKVMQELEPYTSKMAKFSYRAEDLIERLAQTFGMSRKSLREWLITSPNLNHNHRVYTKINEIKFDAPAYERRILIEAIRDSSVTYKLKNYGISLSDFESSLVARSLAAIHTKPLDIPLFSHLESKLSPEEYKEVFILYHNNDEASLDVTAIFDSMQSALVRRRKFTPHTASKRSFLGKPLTSSERQTKTIVSDIIASNDEAKEKSRQTKD